MMTRTPTSRNPRPCRDRPSSPRNTNKIVSTLSPPILSNAVAKNVQLSSSGSLLPPNNKVVPPKRARQSRPKRPVNAKTLSPVFSRMTVANHQPTSKPEEHERPFLASKEIEGGVYRIRKQNDSSHFTILFEKDEEQPVVFATLCKEESAWRLFDSSSDDTMLARLELKHPKSGPNLGTHHTLTFRLYAAKPLYDKQEKTRQRIPRTGFQVMYHWADLKEQPTGLFGRQHQYTMTLHEASHKTFRIVEEKQGDDIIIEHRNEKNKTEPCAVLHEKNDNFSRSIRVQPSTDPLLMVLFLLAMGKLSGM